MTFADVDHTAASLEAEGLTPSGNNVLAALKQRGLRGSKKTVLRFLKQRPVPVPAPAPPPAPPVAEAPPPPPAPPRPLDPVEAARVRLAQAEQALENAREWMDQTCLAFMVSDGLIRNGLRYGGYAREDTARAAVEATARAAMGEYHEAWQRFVQAQQALAQADRQHRRSHREQWVQAQQPGLVEDLASWREALRTATSDRYHAEAKKNVALATQAYEQAVAQAPYSPNGHRP